MGNYYQHISPCDRLLAAKRAIMYALPQRSVLCRRALESHVSATTSCAARDVTRALRDLVEAGLLIRCEVSESYGFTIYYRPGASKSNIEDYISLVHRAHEVLAQAQLREIGEQYARSVLLRSTLYKTVTQRRNLGFAEACNNRRVDIRATALLATPSRIIVEVKNTREVFYPQKHAFSKHIALAIEDGSLPMMVISHISREALELCEDVGIAVLPLGRQIVPTALLQDERMILSQAFGPEGYEYVELGRPFHHGISAKARRDIERASDSAWLAKCQLSWLRTLKRLERYSTEDIRRLALRRLAPWGSV